MALQTLGGPDSALPSTDLKEQTSFGLLFSPSWPGGPAESPGEGGTVILIPQAPSVWGLLPDCILASSGPCLLQKLIQQTAPGRPSSLLYYYFILLLMVPSHLHRALGIASLPRAALPSLQPAPSSPKGV